MRGVVCLVVMLAICAAPRPATACKPVLTAPDDAAKVAAAETKLDEGAHSEAAAQALKLLRLGPLELTVQASPQTPSDRLTNRVVRVYALATVRTGGEVGPWRAKSDTERKLNLEHAERLLGGLAAPKDATPAAKGEHCEALARTKPAEAKKALEALAAKDLVPSAHAWAALARLRGAAGEAKGKEAALAKCKGMAGKQAASVCV